MITEKKVLELKHLTKPIINEHVVVGRLRKSGCGDLVDYIKGLHRAVERLEK